MAMTIHKMRKKNLEIVGKFEALESFKRRKPKDKIGRGSGRVVASPKGNGALKNILHFFSRIFDQK
jgi:hypothetical protein